MGCIYVIDGVEYNEAQLKEYLANNLEAFSGELAGEESEVRGINKAANEMRRQYLNMESYDPDVITNFEANQRAEKWLKEGGDVNELLDNLENGGPVSFEQQEVIKILNMELDAKIAENPTDELLAKQRRLTKINDIIGTDAARQLQARKGMPAPMTTISDYYIDKMNRNGVDVLTKAQKEETKADFEKISKLEKEVEKLREQVNDAAAKELTQREINETKKSGKTGKKVDYAKERNKVIGDIRQKLKNIREGRDGVNAVPLPGVKEFIEIAPDVAKLARLYVQEGVENLGDLVTRIHDVLRTELAGLTKQDVQDMIAGKYNEPRPTKSELQYKVESLRKEAKLLNEIEAVKAGKPKTEKEEIRKNQRIANLNKQLVEAKRQAGYYDDVRIKQAEKTVSKNIEDLKRRIEEKDFEVEKAEKISSPKLEELREEQKALRNEFNELKNEGKVKKDKDQTRLESSVKNVEAQIAEFERRIKEGDYSKKPKRINILDDTELKKKNPELFNKLLDARDKLDNLKFEYAQKMAKEEIASKRGFERAVAETGKFAQEGFNTVKALKAGVDNSVVFIQNGIAVLNPMNIKATAKGLEAQLDVAFSENNFRRRLVAIHENKVLMDMIIRSGLDIIDPKGFRESIVNEQFGGQNWLDKVKFTVSKKGEPYSVQNKEGEWITSEGEKVTKTYKLSDVTSPFERIFAAFSNEFRLQIFLRGAERLMSKGKTLDNNIEDFKSLASYANNITGRGKIHNFLKSSDPLISALVWAPGLMSSSLNIMGLGDAVNLGKDKGYYRAMTKEVRKYALLETSYGIAMGALVMAAMALDPDKEVDSDPISVTFGQVKDAVNGWAYGVYGRFTPYVRYLAMMTLRDKVINGKPVKFDAKAETYKFARGKAAPFTGVAADLMFSQNFQGKQYNLDDKGQIASDLFEPLFIKELREQMKIDGTEAILTRGIPAFMGIKVVNEKMYDKRDLESLLKDTQTSSAMDKNLMVNYKQNPIGNPVTKDEFNEFIKQRDKLIGKYVTDIYQKGVPVTEGENTILKPIKDISKEDLMKAISKIKTLATKKVKKDLFGERPEPEEYLQEDLKLAWEDILGLEEDQ
jgi:hypothetical protein